jgi:hypothetical protein
MDYSLMTTIYIFLAAVLLFLNASSLNPNAYQLLVQTGPDQLVRLGLPPGIDPADALPPRLAKKSGSRNFNAVE